MSTGSLDVARTSYTRVRTYTHVARLPQLKIKVARMAQRPTKTTKKQKQTKNEGKKSHAGAPGLAGYLASPVL